MKLVKKMLFAAFCMCTLSQTLSAFYIRQTNAYRQADQSPDACFLRVNADNSLSYVEKDEATNWGYSTGGLEDPSNGLFIKIPGQDKYLAIVDFELVVQDVPSFKWFCLQGDRVRPDIIAPARMMPKLEGVHGR